MGEIKEELREIIMVTVETLICKSPAKLCGVIISGDGAIGSCDIYDGENTNGRWIIHLEVRAGTTFNWTPNHDVRINNGIFVDPAETTTHVMVSFFPLERHE